MAAGPGDTFATHIFQIELGGVAVEQVQEVSGLTVEVDTIEVTQVTEKGKYIIRKLPGAPKGGEVTITRGMDKSKAFSDWILAAFQKGDISQARKNISIIYVDAKNTHGRQVNLSNAWVSKWEGADLKAGEASPATEKVTIVFEDIAFS